MPNAYRGQVPFQALGLELFLVYRTREYAAQQAALGLCKQGQLLEPPRYEEVPALNLKKDEQGRTVHVTDEDGRMLAAFDAEGKPKLRTVVLNAYEVRKRQVDAFDAALMRPLAKELRIFIRCGLSAWEQENRKLTDEEFDELCEGLGYFGLGELHQEAVRRSLNVTSPDRPDEETEGDGDPNPASPESASQT